MYLFSTMISELSFGLITSIEIFLLTILFSMPLGLAVALGRMSRIRPIQWIMKAYISIMRGTPLMLQLIVIFFAPYYVFGIGLSSDYRMIAVILAFSINYAAYFAEIYRGGFESIPKGQTEAAFPGIGELAFQRRQCDGLAFFIGQRNIGSGNATVGFVPCGNLTLILLGDISVFTACELLVVLKESMVVA